MLKITICIGTACHVKGSKQVVEQLQQLIADNELKEKVDLRGTFCLGNCGKGVNVSIDDKIYSLEPEAIGNFFKTEVLQKVA